MIMWMPTRIATRSPIQCLLHPTNITTQPHTFSPTSSCTSTSKKIIPSFLQNRNQPTQRMPPMKQSQRHHHRNNINLTCPIKTRLNTKTITIQLLRRINRIKSNTMRTTHVANTNTTRITLTRRNKTNSQIIKSRIINKSLSLMSRNNSSPRQQGTIRILQTRKQIKKSQNRTSTFRPRTTQVLQLTDNIRIQHTTIQIMLRTSQHTPRIITIQNTRRSGRRDSIIPR